MRTLLDSNETVCYDNRLYCFTKYTIFTFSRITQVIHRGDVE
jgi:hypothetical protein